MIDDAKIRIQMLKNLPDLSPWLLEMEEVEFGEKIGCTVLIENKRHRFSTRSWGRQGRNFPKKEGTIAWELSEQIKPLLKQADVNVSNSA